jgi:hypothetical protein
MKKPRIDAFDPYATQELGSPMDTLPAIVPPVNKSATTTVPRSPLSPDAPPTNAPVAHPYGRTDGRTDGRRSITRYAFELYQDQVETFRRFALEDKLCGGRGNMSEMVREALDAYIAQKAGSPE